MRHSPRRPAGRTSVEPLAKVSRAFRGSRLRGAHSANLPPAQVAVSLRSVRALARRLSRRTIRHAPLPGGTRSSRGHSELSRASKRSTYGALDTVTGAIECLVRRRRDVLDDGAREPDQDHLDPADAVQPSTRAVVILEADGDTLDVTPELAELEANSITDVRPETGLDVDAARPHGKRRDAGPPVILALSRRLGGRVTWSGSHAFASVAGFGP
jgi:hypothetical protein